MECDAPKTLSVPEAGRLYFDLGKNASYEAAMCELLDDPDPRVRGYAADKVMERAWGKPKDYDPREEQAGGKATDPSQFTPEQRAQIMHALRLIISAQIAAGPKC